MVQGSRFRAGMKNRNVPNFTNALRILNWCWAVFCAWVATLVLSTAVRERQELSWWVVVEFVFVINAALMICDVPMWRRLQAESAFRIHMIRWLRIINWCWAALWGGLLIVEVRETVSLLGWAEWLHEPDAGMFLVLTVLCIGYVLFDLLTWLRVRGRSMALDNSATQKIIAAYYLWPLLSGLLGLAIYLYRGYQGGMRSGPEG